MAIDLESHKMYRGNGLDFTFWGSGVEMAISVFYFPDLDAYIDLWMSERLCFFFNPNSNHKGLSFFGHLESSGDILVIERCHVDECELLIKLCNALKEAGFLDDFKFSDDLIIIS